MPKTRRRRRQVRTEKLTSVSSRLSEPQLRGAVVRALVEVREDLSSEEPIPEALVTTIADLWRLMIHQGRQFSRKTRVKAPMRRSVKWNRFRNFVLMFASEAKARRRLDTGLLPVRAHWERYTNVMAICRIRERWGADAQHLYTVAQGQFKTTLLDVRGI